MVVLPLWIATEIEDPDCLGLNAMIGNLLSLILIPPYRLPLLAFGDTTAWRDRYFCDMLYRSFIRLFMRGIERVSALLTPCAVPRNISLGDNLLRNSFWIRSTSPRFSCVIFISITSDYCMETSATWSAVSPRSYSFSFSSILRYKSTGWGVRRFKSSYHWRDTPASRHNCEMDTLAAFARCLMEFAKSLSLFFIAHIILSIHPFQRITAPFVPFGPLLQVRHIFLDILPYICGTFSALIHGQ